jgi:hypothetical protein
MDAANSILLNAMPRVPWPLALGVAVVGAGLLGFALTRAPVVPVEDTRPQETQIADLETALRKGADQLKTQADAAAARKVEVEAKRQENVKLDARVTTRSGQIQQIEDANGRRIAVLREQLQTLRQKNAQSVEQSNAERAKVAAREQQQRQLENALSQAREALVTVVSANGAISTGFCVTIGGARRCVTVSGIFKTSRPAKVCFQRNGEKEMHVGTADVKYLDGLTGTAILDFKLNTRDGPQTIATPESGPAAPERSGGGSPQAGAKVFALVTQVVGGRVVLQQNVEDGTLSATDRKLGDLTLWQTTLPPNPGTCGSPVLSADGVFLGVLLGPLPDLDRAALILPAKELVAMFKRAETPRSGKP